MFLENGRSLKNYLFFFHLHHCCFIVARRPMPVAAPPIGRRRPLTPLSPAHGIPCVRECPSGRLVWRVVCARVFTADAERFVRARSLARSPGARRRALPVQWTLCTGPTVTPAHAAHHFRIDFILFTNTSAATRQHFPKRDDITVFSRRKMSSKRFFSTRNYCCCCCGHYNVRSIFLFEFYSYAQSRLWLYRGPWTHRV